MFAIVDVTFTFLSFLSPEDYSLGNVRTNEEMLRLQHQEHWADCEQLAPSVEGSAVEFVDPIGQDVHIT